MKRSVWLQTLNRDKEVMHSLDDFCKVAKERNEKIQIIKVTLEEITEEAKEFDTIIKDSRPVKDIKKMHYVNVNPDGSISCQLYSNQEIHESENNKTDGDNDDGGDNNDDSWYNNKCNELMPREKIAVGNYIIVSYEEEYFPGVVTGIENNEAKVLTMQKCRCGWKWPDPNDEIYYTMDNIIKQSAYSGK